MKTTGIHHITAIVGDPRENVQFYERILGLHLVKQTVNFDDPLTYHLYFGNEEGAPGTLMTFFPWPKGRPGKIGGGQVGETVFSVGKGVLPFWLARLQKEGIPVEEHRRGEEHILLFKDPHGLVLQLREGRSKEGAKDFMGIPAAYRIQGFRGAVLYSMNPQKTERALTDFLGFEEVRRTKDYARFESAGPLGNEVDVYQVPMERGSLGTGVVHHIAFRAKDEQEQEAFKEKGQNLSYGVTEVKDRKYFKAIYLREGGGNLFEIATDPPGFSVDEEKEVLGRKLMLPEIYEDRRGEIESVLLPLRRHHED